MTLGDKIRKARENKGLTQKQLAVEIGAKHNSISNWENNQNKPDISYIESMSGVLEVNPSYFFDKTSDKENYTVIELPHIKKYRKLSLGGKRVVDKTMDSVLEYERALNLIKKTREEYADEIGFRFIDLPELPASAGLGEFIDTCYAEPVKVPINNLTNKADFSIRVSGDSMEPQFYDGDIVLVVKQPAIEVGEFGIFILNGEMLLKQMGNNELVSINEKYSSKKISEFDSFCCRGKVIGKLI